MLSGINALTLVHTFTHHWHGQFAIWTSILSLSVNCPLCSFCRHWFGRAKEYEQFWWSNCLRFPKFLSNHHKCDVTFSSNNWHFLFRLVMRMEILWNFPRLDFRFLPFPISELETGLSSNYESEEIGVDTALSKPLQTPNPPSSSSSLPFHASLNLAVYRCSIWGP